MGYEQFGDYLEKQKESFSIKFDEIEEIIGQKLPNSAYQYDEWWSNSDSHPLMKIALSENWKSRKLNLSLKEIEFYKTSESSLLKFLKDNPTMFQNYQAVVIKTLLENGSKFTATINEIKNKIVELNFDRKDFEINSGWASVKEALGNNNIISINGENVKLNDENISDVEKTECLKICGQKIAGFHIDKIVKGDYNLWRMPPGSVKENYPYEREFLKSDTIGIGWGRIEDDVVEKNMTKEQTEEFFHKKYPPKDDDPNSPQAFTNFTHEMKPKDIIVLIKKKTILDFAIVVGSYRYQKDSSIDLPANAKSYSHRRNVVWLNRGSIPESEAFEFSRMSTCDRVKDAQLKEQYIAILRGEKEPKYFLLRHNVKGAWKDDPGKKYHLGRDKKDGRMGKRVRQILGAGVGTKTIWCSTSKGKFYFWGYGTVTGIEEEKKDTDWYLTYDNFKFFEGDTNIQGRTIKRATESVNQQLQELQGDKEWKMNWQFPINPIPKKIYEEITGDRSTMVTSEKQDTAKLERLYQILKRKKQIILYGPPGTGKTYYANQLRDYILSKNAEIASSTIVHDNPDDYDDETILPSFNFFMINGPWAHLKHSLDNEPFLWATKGSSASDIGIYNKLQTNDIIFFSNSTKDPGPFQKKVVFGFGRLVRKFEGTEPYWPDEVKENKVIYKYRLETKIEFITYEPSKAIEWIEGLPYTKGFNSVVNEDVIRKLIAKINRQWADSKYGNRAIQDIKHNVEDRPRSIISTDSFSKNITLHESYSYEDFVEGIRPKITAEDKVTYEVIDGIFKEISKDAHDDLDHKYVLVIDEINRGNIGKILGELITLIEDDKRKESQKTTLPYTHDSFWVPPNLLIIGTMNTADRSIAVIDTALRRRFAFEELMPNYDLKELQKSIDGISLKALLKELNNRIKAEGVQFRDKQIGHSYFMNVKDLEYLRITFAIEIVPLLQDYFFHDYKKLEKILNSDFIDSSSYEIKKEWQKDDKIFKDAINKILDQV